MSEKIIQISKVTSNRQVTIPIEVMRKLKVKGGDKVFWIERDGELVVRKA